MARTRTFWFVKHLPRVRKAGAFAWKSEANMKQHSYVMGEEERRGDEQICADELHAHEVMRAAASSDEVGMNDCNRKRDSACIARQSSDEHTTRCNHLLHTDAHAFIS